MYRRRGTRPSRTLLIGRSHGVRHLAVVTFFFACPDADIQDQITCNIDEPTSYIAKLTELRKENAICAALKTQEASEEILPGWGQA